MIESPWLVTCRIGINDFYASAVCFMKIYRTELVRFQLPVSPLFPTLAGIPEVNNTGYSPCIRINDLFHCISEKSSQIHVCHHKPHNQIAALLLPLPAERTNIAALFHRRDLGFDRECSHDTIRK